MEEQKYQRVLLLFEQGRYVEADELLGELISQDPTNAYLLALSAEISLELRKVDRALQLIDSAIRYEAENDYFFYVKARVLLHLENLNEAENFLGKAVELKPNDGDYYALWAQVKVYRKQYQAGLDLANKALEFDSENTFALNTRTEALVKLGKKEEAFANIEGALEQAPNDSDTHANAGWAYLEQEEHEKALNHFREALKLNPNNGYAQAGMVEALKSRYFIYRLFMKYNFFMAKLSEKYQWGFIIGLYLVYRFLGNISANNPELQPILRPVLILIAVFAFSTWVMEPLSNLFFRLNKYGKHLLNDNEKMSSNFVGISALVSIIGFVTYFPTQHEPWLALGIFGFAMMVPLGVMFYPSKYKNSLLFYAIGMAGVGLGAVAYSFNTGELINPLSSVFLVGFIAFQWIANFLFIRQSNV